MNSSGTNAATGAAELLTMSAVELRKLIGRRALSPVELVDVLIAHVRRIDPLLNAFCHFDEDMIRGEARAAERAAAGTEPLSLLHGLPIPVKDLIVTKGMTTTRGSTLFRNDVPAFDAPVVERLRKAGGIVFGKTNTSELGWKGAGSNRVYKETRNPWNPERSPGGSSAGAAAALATGMCAVALGTDGGGSVRMPASFCNVFGFKPSVGRWPLFPPAPIGPLSHVGPMSRTVDDAALLFRAISGADVRDIYSMPASTPPEILVQPLENVRVGWSPDLGFMPVDAEIRAICEAAVRRFEAARCEVVPLDVKIDDPRDVLETIFATGIGSLVRRFPDWETKIDPGLADLVKKGETCDPFKVAEAHVFRGSLSAQVERAMAGVDVLVTPTVPVKTFALGEDGPPLVAGEVLGPVRWFGLTATFNITGQPAASVPCGFDSEGMPVGLQIVGPPFADELVLRVAKTFEEISPWKQHWPELSGLSQKQGANP